MSSLKSDKKNVYGQQRKAKRDAWLFRLSNHALTIKVVHSTETAL